jgi:hypothetical protein
MRKTECNQKGVFSANQRVTGMNYKTLTPKKYFKKFLKSGIILVRIFYIYITKKYLKFTLKKY